MSTLAAAGWSRARQDAHGGAESQQPKNLGRAVGVPGRLAITSDESWLSFGRADAKLELAAEPKISLPSVTIGCLVAECDGEVSSQAKLRNHTDANTGWA